jgi:hypothetical protein
MIAPACAATAPLMKGSGRLGPPAYFFRQDCVVNVRLKSERDRVEVWCVAVAGELWAINDADSQIGGKRFVLSVSRFPTT